jgi:hypothetical protein
MSGQDVEIERLTLRLHGVMRPDAESVARLVADGLAAQPAKGGKTDVKAQVTASGGPEEVARSILAELRRQMQVDR